MFHSVIILLGVLNLILLAVLFRTWKDLGRVARLGLGGVSLVWLPIAFAASTVLSGMEEMKEVTFCGSCHVMEDYVASLKVEDDEALAAVHYLNNYTSQKTACFECHTQYTMFGGVKAKLNGLKHVWVYYTGQTPEKLALYQPYNNRDCLHCHEPAKRFQDAHVDDIEGIKSGDDSCLDCHDIGHHLGGSK